MTVTSHRYDVEAFNTATASTNKIHDDSVARTYGFRGGLVPGVDVYAYLARAPVEQWGPEWLSNGSISVRFAQPVYEGDRVTVTVTTTDAALDLMLTDPTGAACATGRAALGAADVDRRSLPGRPLPATRRPASPASMRPGTVLGSLSEVFHADPTAIHTPRRLR